MLPRWLLLFGLLTLGLGLPGLRAQVVWTGIGDDDIFSTNENWVGFVAPGSSATAQFGPHGNYSTVRFLHPTTIGNIEFLATRTAIYTFTDQSDFATIHLGGGITLQSGPDVNFTSSLTLNLTNNTTGNFFDIASGATLEINGVITGPGHFAKLGAGTLVLTGANTFNYTGGGSFTNSTAIKGGTVHLDGGSINHSGTGDVTVGDQAGDHGTLWVTNGGHVTDYYGVFGQSIGSTGLGLISGVGSTWTNSAGMDIGYSGSGTLTVADGGVVAVTGGTNTISLGTSGGTGVLNIGAAAGDSPTAGGLINANTITTGSGSGTLQFNTTGTLGSPYYLTKNGLAAGTAVAVTGGTQVIVNAGYTVFTGPNTYTAGTRLNGGTLVVSGAGSITHTSANTVVGFGSGDSASLLISGGADVADYQGRVGFGASSTGSVSVTGAGSTWTHSNYLYVGLEGDGALTVSAGGAVSSPNTSIGNNFGGLGAITVTGAGSTLNNSANLYVGSEGEGQLSLLSGGVATNVNGIVGNNNGGAGGIVTVTGAGSAWNNSGYLLVGGASDGSLSILSQGSVTAASLAIADLEAVYGSVFLSGVGSSLGTTGNLFVGVDGDGELDIISGATVTTGGYGSIGENFASFGSVEILGAGSTWTLGGDLYIGNGGEGKLYLRGAGTINVGSGTGTVHLGHSAGGEGSLYIGYDGEGLSPGGVVNAATITTDAGASGTVKLGTSASSASPYYLTKTGGSGGTPVVVTGPTALEQYGGYNVIAGANSYSGGTSLFGGTLVVDSSSALGTGSITVYNGTLLVTNNGSITNSLTLSGGRLGGDGYVQTVAIGTNVTLAPGMPGQLGEMYFDHLELAPNGTLEWHLQDPAPVEGLGWDTLYVQTSATLDITATTSNKFSLKLISLDGAGAPGMAVGFTPGQSYSWLIFNTDGIAGFDPAKFTFDSSLFSTNAGAGTFSLSKTGNNLFLNFSPVPEPSTYALILAGLGLAGLRCWRRRA